MLDIDRQTQGDISRNSNSFKKLSCFTWTKLITSRGRGGAEGYGETEGQSVLWHFTPIEGHLSDFKISIFMHKNAMNFVKSYQYQHISVSWSRQEGQIKILKESSADHTNKQYLFIICLESTNEDTTITINSYTD